MIRLYEEAHRLVRPHVRPGDVAVDATAGNGSDAAFLAGLVGPAGRVLAFDVQPDALAATAARLDAAGLRERVTLVHAGHERLGEFVAPGSAAAVVFNLGYRPRGDRTLCTRADTTVAALGQALEVVRPGGVVAVTAYPTHPAGAAVEAWLAGLDAGRFAVAGPVVQGGDGPRLWAVTRT